MVKRNLTNRKVFNILNYIILGITAFTCILPFIHVLSISLSSSWAATAGMVKLWPVGFTVKSYDYALTKPEFIASMIVSLKRVGLGAIINMLLTIMAAYPLSKDKKTLRMRNVYSWFFVVTILFNGGLIPWYVTISALGLRDTIMSLVLPGAVQVFNIILLMNFFRQLPKEIEESVFIDGASHWTNLWKIQVPLSLPAIATLLLFSIVGHWNSWFDGLILMDSPAHYPLQSYLQTVVTALDSKLKNTLNLADVELLSEISDRTTRAAQIFIAMIPILCVYPFLQKYFMTGIVIGSVKG